MPLSLAVGTKDSLLDQKSNEQIKEYLDTEKKNVPHEVVYYEDQVHGFALRGYVVPYGIVPYPFPWRECY